MGTLNYYASLLDSAYKNIKSKLIYIIKNDNPESVAISLDAWSQHHNGYLGINCNYINNEWQRKVLNLCCTPFNESHTSIHIRE